MRVTNLSFSIVLLVLSGVVATAQQTGSQRIAESLERDGCVGLESDKVKVCKYDYVSDGQSVEAVSFRPAGAGPFPGILLIPGYQRTAMNLIPLGVSPRPRRVRRRRRFATRIR